MGFVSTREDAINSQWLAPWVVDYKKPAARGACVSGIMKLFGDIIGKPALIFEPQQMPLPSGRLELSNELPALLAGQLRGPSCDGIRRCGVAGAAGPMFAVLFGAADAAGAKATVRAALHTIARSELRQLSDRLGVPAMDADESGSGGVALNQTVKRNQSSRPDAFELALGWCASPAIPTYDVGVHLVLGDADALSTAKAATCAWVLRLICRRNGVNLAHEAPTLAAIAKALCETKDPAEEICAILNAAPKKQRRVTIGEAYFPRNLNEDRPRSLSFTARNLSDF